MSYDIRAYLTLLMFVPLSLVLVAATPRQRSVSAVFWIYMGGLMFLPELAAFDFPLMPPLDKNGFAGIMGLIAALMLERQRVIDAKPLRGVDAFFFLVLIGNAGTAFTNGDTLIFGADRFTPTGEQWSKQVVITGLRPYDILSASIRDFLAIYVPFLLGRSMFRTAEDGEVIMKGVITIGLIYLMPALLEIRLSPYIHNFVYGYHSTGFAGVARSGGFKPVVFLNSGLAVAMFLVTCILSSATLMRRRTNLFGMPMMVPLVVLWILLGLSHNVGATLYSLAAVPLVLMSRGRTASLAARVLAIAVIVYPLVRAAGLIDTDAIIQWIAERAPERAQSLHTRFFNEDQLMERARQRLWWGWGGFGRNRIYDDYGKDVSITDGEWIIRIGARGIVGFIASFGLLVGPIFIARRWLGKIQNIDDRRLVDTMALIVALNAVDLLPNGLFTQMPFFMAGALAGLAHGLGRDAPRARLQR